MQFFGINLTSDVPQSSLCHRWRDVAGQLKHRSCVFVIDNVPFATKPK